MVVSYILRATQRISPNCNQTLSSTLFRACPRGLSAGVRHVSDSPNSRTSLKEGIHPQAIGSVKINSTTLKGTCLTGINYIKGREDPIALADEEYPPWLWTTLETSSAADNQGAGKEEHDSRLYSKSAKSRRAANKRLRAKKALATDSVEQKPSIFEETTDLPHKGESGQHARHDLQKAMRAKRRGDIKTSNFLKGMD